MNDSHDHDPLSAPEPPSAPDVPAPRVAALRRAFDATMKDPAFIAEAARLQFDVDPLTGEQVQALVGELAATPREIVARVRAALEAPGQ